MSQKQAKRRRRTVGADEQNVRTQSPQWRARPATPYALRSTGSPPAQRGNKQPIRGARPSDPSISNPAIPTTQTAPGQAVHTAPKSTEGGKQRPGCIATLNPRELYAGYTGFVLPLVTNSMKCSGQDGLPAVGRHLHPLLGSRFVHRRVLLRQPCLRPPLEIHTDELDHAARVTEEAEMDIPSPPFSSCRDCILSRQSLQQKILLLRKEGMERCSLNRRDV